MDPESGIGEGAPALWPSRPFRLLCLARRGGLYRLGGDRLGRNDDRRGNILLWIAVGGVLGVILHEAVHGVFFLAFGGRPRFGFKPWTRFGPVFYAAAPGSYFDRPRYLAAGLSPAVLLTSVLAVALAFAAADDLLASVLTWAFVLNVAGSAGDMLMMRKVMSYPRATCFEDTGDGFVAYGSAGSLESP